jgi:hypothetical protein
MDKISIKYREVFKNELHTLTRVPIGDRKIKVVELKNSIEDSFATGKISELQYNLLNEKLSYHEKK